MEIIKTLRKCKRRGVLPVGKKNVNQTRNRNMRGVLPVGEKNVNQTRNRNMRGVLPVGEKNVNQTRNRNMRGVLLVGREKNEFQPCKLAALLMIPSVAPDQGALKVLEAGRRSFD